MLLFVEMNLIHLSNARRLFIFLWLHKCLASFLNVTLLKAKQSTESKQTKSNIKFNIRTEIIYFSQQKTEINLCIS